METKKRPLGNLINNYVVLFLVDIVLMIIAISTNFWWSFWLFMVAVIFLPILAFAMRLAGTVTFLFNPKSTSQQLSREVIKPIFKSKMILFLFIITTIVFIWVRWYIQH